MVVAETGSEATEASMMVGDEAEDYENKARKTSSKQDPPDHSNEEEDKPLLGDKPTVHWSRRWCMMLLFSINYVINIALFVSYIPIGTRMSEYYNQPQYVFDWVQNGHFIFYVLFGIPAVFLLHLKGIRLSLIVASSLNAVASCLRLAGSYPDQFVFVACGQIAAGAGFVMLPHMPAVFAYTLFPEESWTVSLGVAGSLPTAGCVLAFALSAICSDTADQRLMLVSTRNMYVVYMVLCLFVYIVTVTMYEMYPLNRRDHCGKVATEEDTKGDDMSIGKFINYFKTLAGNRSFHVLTQAYAIYTALAYFIILNIQRVIKEEQTSLTDSAISWVWVGFTVIALPSTATLGFFIDKAKKIYLAGVLFNLCSVLTYLIFTLVLRYSDSLEAICIVLILHGIVGLPYIGIGLHQVEMLTAQVPVGISSAVVLCLSLLYGLIFNGALGYLVEVGYAVAVDYAVVGLYAFSTVMAASMNLDVMKN